MMSPTYNELLVANSHGEVAIERNAEVFRIEPLSCDDMFQ
jgi:hypothetical protein